MSYALESKKRKFNRVLESISRPLSNESSAKKIDPIAAAKERLATQPTVKRVRLSGDGNDLELLKPSVAKSLRLRTTSPNLRPNFVPWDRDRFLERLATFRRVDRWSSTPAPINEVEWAKWGWSCTDVMQVSCVGGCEASVVVKLPDEIDELDGFDPDKIQERKEVRDKLVEEYQRLLASGHKENCPWRNRGCDSTIHRLPLSNADIAIDGLRKRYLALQTLGPKLPSEDNIELPENIDLGEILKLLPSAFLPHQHSQAEAGSEGSDTLTQDLPAASSTIHNPADIVRAAFALALFGWELDGDGTNGLVECRACFRRLGLWMYKPKPNGDVTVYEKLNVVEEHMEYCPWVSGNAQSGHGRADGRVENLQSGWQLLVQGIKTKHRRLTRGSSSENLNKDSHPISVDDLVDDTTNRAKDREWWSRIRRLKEALHVKGSKKTPIPSATDTTG